MSEQQQERHTVIPRDAEKRLRSLLLDLEAETGSRFQCTVRKAGTDSSLVIGAFDERTDYVISGMRPGYEALNGGYTSMAAIKEQVLWAKYGAMRQPGGKHWICPQCGQCEGQVGRANSVATSVWSDLCQFCPYRFDSQWNCIDFDFARGIVYTSHGGSIAICHPLGKIAVY